MTRGVGLSSSDQPGSRPRSAIRCLSAAALALASGLRRAAPCPARLGAGRAEPAVCGRRRPVGRRSCGRTCRSGRLPARRRWRHSRNWRHSPKKIAAHAEAVRLSARRTALEKPIPPPLAAARRLERARAKLRGDQLVKFVPRIGGFDVITAGQAFPDRPGGGQHTAQRIRPRTWCGHGVFAHNLVKIGARTA